VGFKPRPYTYLSTIGAVVLSIAKHSLDNIHGEADVAYVGTKATVSSGYYDTKFRGVLDRVHWHARSVFKLSADNLADLIETDGAESKKLKVPLNIFVVK